MYRSGDDADQLRNASARPAEAAIKRVAQLPQRPCRTVLRSSARAAAAAHGPAAPARTCAPTLPVPGAADSAAAGALPPGGRGSLRRRSAGRWMRPPRHRRQAHAAQPMRRFSHTRPGFSGDSIRPSCSSRLSQSSPRRRCSHSCSAIWCNSSAESFRHHPLRQQQGRPQEAEDRRRIDCRRDAQPGLPASRSEHFHALNSDRNGFAANLAQVPPCHQQLQGAGTMRPLSTAVPSPLRSTMRPAGRGRCLSAVSMSAVHANEWQQTAPRQS